MIFLSASLLLDSLLSYLTSKERVSCKAVYLHVLATNTVAIRFYQRRSFHPHSFLPFYYSIQGKPRDGYSYVLYVNGGQPPWSLIYPFLRVWTVVRVWGMFLENAIFLGWKWVSKVPELIVMYCNVL